MDRSKLLGYASNVINYAPFVQHVASAAPLTDESSGASLDTLRQTSPSLPGFPQGSPMDILQSENALAEPSPYSARILDRRSK